VIYEITQELKAALEARGVPVPVEYGPEPKTSTAFSRTRIVVERDRQGGDSIPDHRSVHRNPRMHGVRAMGAVCRIYASSTVTGASVHDHERLADQLADKVQVALRQIVSTRRTLWRVLSAKLLSAAELGQLELETWHGVVYELRFQVDRGVLDTSWTDDASVGAARPTGTLTGVDITDRINGAGGLVKNETAC
jgi:hypothetical protein